MIPLVLGSLSVPERGFRLRRTQVTDLRVRSHPPVTFAVLALGVGAFALLQSLGIQPG